VQNALKFCQLLFHPPRLAFISNSKEMKMQINTNMNALYASNSLRSTSLDIANSVQRISSGQQLAQDNPSSIGMGARLKAQIGGLSKINEGLNIGMGMAQAMSEGLAQVADTLSSMYDLAVSSNNNYAEADVLTANGAAYDQLTGSINTNISSSALYGTDTNLLGDDAGVDLMITEDGGTTLTLNTYDVTSLTSLAEDITTQGGASGAVTKILADIGTVSKWQAEVGGAMKVISAQANVNNAVSAGLTSSYTNVTSTDIAAETAKLATEQIRQNAAAAMFAQSNTMTREVVSYLLKGL
jgi:flagellin